MLSDDGTQSMSLCISIVSGSGTSRVLNKDLYAYVSANSSRQVRKHCCRLHAFQIVFIRNEILIAKMMVSYSVSIVLHMATCTCFLLLQALRQSLISAQIEGVCAPITVK